MHHMHDIRERTTTDSKACHFLLSADHRRSLLLKSSRNTRNTNADPIEEATAAKANPFMPYANPHSVVIVVWPMKGGKQTST